MLKLLHTADWHIGRRFPTFDEESQKKLSRARLDVVSTIFDVARRNAVHAILCAGDLFETPDPAPEFWEGLAAILRGQPKAHSPTFLVPGNHDPLVKGSVWASEHPFRRALPPWAHVVDRDDFTYSLGTDAVLHARPCCSMAGENDLAMLLPAREAGDERLRIGCVHGSTFDLPDHQTNFPIARDAAIQRGFDYLAIGDVHSFRDVLPDQLAPIVYPGAPEATSFDEPGAGNVAMVAMFRRGSRPRVVPERVGKWKWVDVACHDLNELRGLMTGDLRQSVVRLRLEMTVSLAEQGEVERMVRELRGTAATHGRAGVVLVNDEHLRVDATSARDFPADLPPVIRETVNRLEGLLASAQDDATREHATRALSHLFRLLQTHDRGSEVRA